MELIIGLSIVTILSVIYFESRNSKKDIHNQSHTLIINNQINVVAQSTVDHQFDRRISELEVITKNSIIDGSDLEIEYSNADSNYSKRTIKPLYLKTFNSTLYLVAFCKLRMEERTFALSRIQTIKKVFAAKSSKQIDSEANLITVIKSRMATANVKTIDLTQKGGCLWFVVNKKNAQNFNRICKGLEITPSFTKNGSKNTDYKPAYFLKVS